MMYFLNPSCEGEAVALVTRFTDNNAIQGVTVQVLWFYVSFFTVAFCQFVVILGEEIHQFFFIKFF